MFASSSDWSCTRVTFLRWVKFVFKFFGCRRDTGIAPAAFVVFWPAIRVPCTVLSFFFAYLSSFRRLACTFRVFYISVCLFFSCSLMNYFYFSFMNFLILSFFRTGPLVMLWWALARAFSYRSAAVGYWLPLAAMKIAPLRYWRRISSSSVISSSSCVFTRAYLWDLDARRLSRALVFMMSVLPFSSLLFDRSFFCLPILPEDRFSLCPICFSSVTISFLMSMNSRP